MMLHLVIITIITLLLLSGSIFSVVQADIIITLPWCKPAAAATATAGDDAATTTTTTTNYYEPRQARVGDEIVFQWSDTGNYHNVLLLYPNGGGDNCTDTTAEKVFISEQSGASYIFQPADIGKNLTFVCSVSDHCRMGQHVTFFGILPEFTTATTTTITAAVAANNDTTTGDDTNNNNATIDYLLSTPCGFDGFLQRSNDDEAIVPTMSASSSSAKNDMMTDGDGGGGSGGIARTMCTILLLRCAVVAALTMII
mmetsp:Transcript_23292/g.26969  ORF Transcript_23292/g.26969 Transcript_23292/m.26969 type:complete len:255 (+) Transcript_23292:164-928(+)